MRIEQIGIEIDDCGCIVLSQDDHGMGEMAVAIPIIQWEYVCEAIKKEIEKETKQGAE